jgi:hypothetical protein
MSVIERKTRHQRTFERDSGGSKPYSLVATNSCGTRITEAYTLEEVIPNVSDALSALIEAYQNLGKSFPDLAQICL